MLYEEKLAKVDNWRSDVTFFLKDCFPHIYSNDFAKYHYEIFDILKNNKKIGLAAARGHGKSRIVTFGWVMWNLLCNPKNRFTIIVSATYENACAYLKQIKDEIEHNPVIREVFGDLKSDKWSENMAEFTHRKCVMAGGREIKIRGKTYLENRPDLIVGDDIEDSEQVRSEQRREDLVR